jgi:hypothetical protein
LILGTFNAKQIRIGRDTSSDEAAPGSCARPLRNKAQSFDFHRIGKLPYLDQIKVKGTLHKIIPLPIELIGTIVAVPDDKMTKFRCTLPNSVF